MIIYNLIFLFIFNHNFFFFLNYFVKILKFIISSWKVDILFKKMKNGRVVHRWINLIIFFWNFHDIILLLQLIDWLIFFFILIIFQYWIYFWIFFGLYCIRKTYTSTWLFAHLSIVHVCKWSLHVLFSSLNIAHSQRSFMIWTQITWVHFLGVVLVVWTIYNN
jgi:hypothetical protein